MRKILVTGGMGYIGSHTTVELIEAGFEVVIADNLSNSKIEVLDGIREITNVMPSFEQVDLCDKEEVIKMFERHSNIEAVIHFAAHKAVGESVEFPLKYYGNNITSMINVLSQMRKRKINNFVFSSSATVYGEAAELPVTENSPLQKASSPYGATKQICEDIVNDLAKSDLEFRAITLRYFNPIGAHQSALIGELPLGVPANLIPFVTQTAIGRREELQVFGDDYATHDGTCVRDYIHVVDLAQAHVKSIQRMLVAKKEGVEIFNLGTGTGTSVMQVIKAFEKVSGKKLNYRVVARRAGDVEKLFTSTKLANEVLDWRAEKDLEEALVSAWRWEQCLEGKRL